MKGDFTRRTFRPEKHYSSVQMQQGRVQLDSDWNEEVAIIDHRWRATLEDAVGASGAPKVGGGFQLSPVQPPNSGDFIVSPGRIYVDGILCELDAPTHDATVTGQFTLSIVGLKVGETTLAPGMWINFAELAANVTGQALIHALTPPGAGSNESTLTLTQLSHDLPTTLGTVVTVSPIVTYLTQPDLPSPPTIDLTVPQGSYYGSTYVAYLDVFQRHLTAIDDPAIREVALNGPDTGTRTRTTWQVRMVKVDSMSTCADVRLPAVPNPPAGQFTPPFASTARMRARAVPTSDPTQDCLLPAEAGFRRLENQLYRVEIHQAGTFADATFKWSRDNGSVAVAWTGTPANKELSIAGTPQDAAQGFASGQWIELVDDARELSFDGAVVGTFVQLGVPNGDILTIDPLTATGTLDFAQFSGHPKVRRWESKPQKVSDVGADLWITLEDGVEIQFDPTAQNPWFNKGDYWLIPARTATTDVEWPNDPPGVPAALQAYGIEHRYCALALLQVHSGGQVTALDCRPSFPALTAIAASDVSYDNSSCQLINATTVQQAIDALCKARDMAHHNRLIHGYGIVCGLQVECNPNAGMWVTVKSGYAIDCNGNDVEISDLPVDLGGLVSNMRPSPLDANGDGAISLLIGLDQHSQVKVSAEPYQAKENELTEIFGGTLLADIYEDCVRPWQLFMAQELAKLPGDPPIGSGEELASAFVNLLAQGPNPQAGQNVYISTKEDQLLSTFYADLKAQLNNDPTFCGLLEGARPYPTGGDRTMQHIFGTGQQTRLKWRPGAHEFYTVSNGTDPTSVVPRINRYNSDTGALMAQIDPTDGTPTGPIVDLTFDSSGNTIYVILNSTSATDTFYRTGTITSAGITWASQLVTLTGSRLSAIESYRAPTQERLIAISPGTGAYDIDPTTIKGPSITLTPFARFNAFDQIAISHWDEPETLVVAVPYNSSTAAQPTTYDSVWVFATALAIPIPVTTTISLPSSGSDGAVLSSSNVELFVVVDGPPKTIIGYTYSFNFQAPFGIQIVRVRDSHGANMAVPVDDGHIRMATADSAAGQMLFWTAQDFYTVNLVDLSTHLGVNNWTLPTQVGPVDVGYSSTTGKLAILNRPCDSVLLVPASLLSPTAGAQTQTVFSSAVAYHTPAVEAYADLFAAFAQYVKDCVFDHFAVKCAECNPRTQKLYLGAVAIRNSKVYSICNFSQRHYLKTFPTLGYWLSLFPILPIISEIIEMVSCTALPDLAAKYKGAAYVKPVVGSTPSWSLESLFNTFQDIQKADLRGQLTQWLQRFGLSRHVAGLGAGFKSLGAAPAAGKTGFVVGSSTAAATGALGQMGLTAQAQPFRAALGTGLIGNMVDIFRPPAGPTGPVALHTSSGQVLFTSNPPAQPSVASLQQQLQAKDVQLQQMQAQLQTVNTQLADLHTFRQQVTQQLATLPKAPGPGGPTPPMV